MYSNRANPHAHFPGRAAAYAAPFCSALNNELTQCTIPSNSVQIIRQSRFNPYCGELRSRRNRASHSSRLRRRRRRLLRLSGRCRGGCCRSVGGSSFALFACLSYDEAIISEVLARLACHVCLEVVVRKDVEVVQAGVWKCASAIDAIRGSEAFP